MKKQKTLHVRAINWLNEEHDLCEELKNELNNTGLQKNTPFKIDESHICLLHNYKIEKNYIVINIIEYEKDYNPPIIYLATGDVDTQAPPESSEFIHSQTTLCIDKNYIFGFRHIHRFTESHSAGLIRGLIKKLGCSEKLCDFELLKFANPKELHKILDNDSIAKVILPIGNGTPPIFKVV